MTCVNRNRKRWACRFRLQLHRLVLGSFLVLAQALVGCGPTFPAYWQIPAEATDSGGTLDPDGKLRILALAADPPEILPGGVSKITALVATHPRYGETVTKGQEIIDSMRPKGLSVLYRVCQPDNSQAAIFPCGLFAHTENVSELSNHSEETTVLDIPFAVFAAPLGSEKPAGPVSWIVTLFAADAAFPGGASACAEAAVQNGGVSPNPNHCAFAVKRVKVSQAEKPNHNPGFSALRLRIQDVFADLSSRTATVSKLPPELADADRPAYEIIVERTPESEEQEIDPKNQNSRAEWLTATAFVTAGTLDAGRGHFLDLDCEGECPQRLSTSFFWQPPAGRMPIEAPFGNTHFAFVLRDDRGGTAFALGFAKAQ